MAISDTAQKLVQQILRDVSASLQAEVISIHSMQPLTVSVRHLSQELVGTCLQSAFKHLSAMEQHEGPLPTHAALAMIKAIIERWPISEQWKYSLSKPEATPYCTARFSVPTRRRPAPNADVIVHFDFEQSEPKWWIEGQRCRHRLNVVCQEAWLKSMVANKRGALSVLEN
eukprot:m.7524 g.7524  ORF g.7524 m.7524 type:complete len:171 (+) comp8858_c0_seq1:96-608(+)